MTLFLIYLFFRKLNKLSLVALLKKIAGHSNLPVLIFFAGLIVLLLLIPVFSKSQSSTLNYKIVQGGEKIGWLQLEKNIIGNKTNLELISELSTRFVFLVEVFAKETSVFENGQLLYSSQFRKTNGTVKVDKQTSRVADKYVVTNDGDKQYLSIPVVATNLLSLYFQEPTGITTVYCDKYGCFVKISRADDGGHKIVFPDGNSNTFYYHRGICTKIRISHTFYTAEIIKTS